MSKSEIRKIEIRELRADDVSEVARIKVDGWKRAYKGIMEDECLDDLSVEEQSRIFADCVGSNNFIAAVLDGEVVGFCRFVYDNSLSLDLDYVDCELTAIYVRPDLKGQGVGTKMFKNVVEKFKDKNKTTMVIWCLADNVDSVKFYEHMGGKIKESRMIKIGNKNYKEVGIVYDLKEL